jgi:alpha-1,3-rhamnosyl/mannosyltransferase
MKIAIDVTALLPQITGVDTYLRELVYHLAKMDRHNKYLICHNLEDWRQFVGRFPGNVSLCSISARPRPLRLLAQQLALPAVVTAWKADVVHSPSFIMPYIRGLARHVLTVHDMTSFSHPHCHVPLRRSEIYKQMVFTSLRRADIVIAPSQATRQAIMEFLPDLSPEHIHVTALGISEEFKPYSQAEVREVLTRLNFSQPYILYVGTLEPRKNLPTLVESYRRLVELGAVKEHLVLAGKIGWDCEGLLEQLKISSLRGRVHLAGYIGQEDLPAVYAGARVFVYPSLHEGFGFPPLEAMACGVPVISTRTSSLIENLDGAAELVDPRDVNGLAEAMRRLVTDDVLRAGLRTKGLERVSRYRWDQTASETLKVYQRALAMPRGNG